MSTNLLFIQGFFCLIFCAPLMPALFSVGEQFWRIWELTAHWSPQRNLSDGRLTKPVSPSRSRRQLFRYVERQWRLFLEQVVNTVCIAKLFRERLLHTLRILRKRLPRINQWIFDQIPQWQKTGISLTNTIPAFFMTVSAIFVFVCYTLPCFWVPLVFLPLKDGPASFQYPVDLIALIGVLNLGSFWLALGGVAATEPHAVRSVGRFMIVYALREIPIFALLMALVLMTGSTSPEILFVPSASRLGAENWFLVAVLWAMIIPLETFRRPIDDPHKGLDIISIEENIVHSYVGRPRVLVEWGMSLKFFFFLTVPVGILYTNALAVISKLGVDYVAVLPRMTLFLIVWFFLIFLFASIEWSRGRYDIAGIANYVSGATGIIVLFTLYLFITI